MKNILSLKDLNTQVNHEPRVEDLLLGHYLGLTRPRDIRATIEKNREELELHGSLAVTNRKSRGQTYNEYYLTEGQALVLCSLSRTAKAAEVRKAIIDVFMAYRKGQLQPTNQIVITEELDQAIGNGIEDTYGRLMDMMWSIDALEGIKEDHHTAPYLRKLVRQNAKKQLRIAKRTMEDVVNVLPSKRLSMLKRAIEKYPDDQDVE